MPVRARTPLRDERSYAVLRSELTSLSSSPSPFPTSTCALALVTSPRLCRLLDAAPHAHFAVLKRYRKHWNMDLVLKPVFLGGVMAASGNQPPLKIPNKGKWMNRMVRHALSSSSAARLSDGSSELR